MLQEPKGQLESVNQRRTDNTMTRRRRTDNTMTRRRRTDNTMTRRKKDKKKYKQRSIKHIQKTKDRVT